MAFVQQYRSLCKRVKQQLDDFNDGEKGRVGRRHSNDSQTSPSDEKDFPYAGLDGVSLETTDSGEKYYLVDFESKDDPANPQNWSTFVRARTTFVLILIAFEVTAASSIDSGVAKQIAMDFGISQTTAALSGTAIFLIGFGVGALLAAPASEMVGRYPVYLSTLGIFGCWLIGAALSPNVGAQIAFRFLAGLSGSAPLTVAGGTMSDIWNQKEKTLAFPLFALIGFGGPVLGPVISSYMGWQGPLSWRWAEWIMLISDGLVMVIVFVFMGETLAPRLLKYKAGHLRKLTGDSKFKSKEEASGESLTDVLKSNFTRPFMLALEPIVLLFTLYLTVVYIVLFTFLDGYPNIFEKTYGINQGLSNLCFIGLFIGILLSILSIPLVWSITKKQLERDGDDGTGAKLDKESRNIFSMIGAPAIPLGLFWMAWTDYVSCNHLLCDRRSSMTYLVTIN